MEERILSATAQVVEVSGSAVVVSASQGARGIERGETLTPQSVLLLGDDADVLVRTADGILHLSQNCVACLSVFDDSKTAIASTTIGGEFGLQLSPTEPAYTEQDIAVIQKLISEGQDLRQALETDALVRETDAENSANGGFVSVAFNYPQVLASTDFETDDSLLPFELVEDDGLTISFAEGGGSITTGLVEGSLSQNSYPQTTVGSVFIEQATFELDAETFVVAPLDIDQVLAELNAHITSAGEAVIFVYDQAANAIVGTVSNDEVLSITITTNQLDTGIDLVVTTAISSPIDHIDFNGQYVAINDDKLNINFDITGQDSSGFDLVEPISFSTTIADGINPVFGSVSATGTTTLNEGDGISTNRPADGDTGLSLGSDSAEFFTIDTAILSDPSWLALTSNGMQTSLSLSSDSQVDVDANPILDKVIVTLADAPNIVVLEIVVKVDGTYIATLMQPLDQGADNLTQLQIPVKVVDYDGDLTPSVIQVVIEDGQDPTGESSLLDYIETVGEQSQTRHIEFTKGSDNLDDISFEVSVVDDPAWTSIQSNGVATEVLLSDDAKTLTVQTLSGELVLKVVIDNSGDYTLTQYRAIEQDNDILRLTIPTTATDTDGDSVTENINLVIRDNISPQGEPSEVDYIETGTQGQTINGQIDFTVFSDAIDVVQFASSMEVDPSWTELTSNGSPLTVSLLANNTILSLSTVESPNDVVMSISINRDGSYTLVQNAALDHPIDNLLQLPITVIATDFDGDSANAQITIKVSDGINPSAQNSSITYTELDDAVRSAVGTVQINKGSDDIASVVFSPVIADDSNWLDITSNGVATELRIEDNVVTLYYQVPDSIPVQEVVVLRATIGLDGRYVIEQFDSIDQDDDSLDIVLTLPVVVTDSDDDVATAQITLTILDGANPSAGDALVEFEEKATEQTFIDQFEIEAGVDAIQSIVFNEAVLTNDNWTGLLTNDSAVQLSLSSDGTLLTVALGDDLSSVVLEVELLDVEGNFRVTQFQALDHSQLEQILLTLQVDLTDTDGDVISTEIGINISDGDDPSLQQSTAPDINETGAEVSVTGSVAVVMGSDNVDSVVFDETTLVADDTWTELLSNNRATEVSVTGNVLVVYISPDPNNIVLQAQINADGSYTVTQFQALEHNSSDSLSLTLPIVVTDTDNDVARDTITVNIIDGTDPVISNSSVTLSDDTTENLASEMGSVDLVVGSDVVESINIDLSDQQTAQWDAVTSNGQSTTLTVVGGSLVLTLDDDSEVLRFDIGLDGHYVITQFLPLDQPLDNQSLLSATVIATDADGDTDTALIDITIQDGVDPSSADSTVLAIDENDISSLETGDIALIAGVDAIASVRFNASVLSDADWLGLLSDNRATQLNLSQDGSVLTVHIVDNEDDVVLRATVNIDGSYSIEQLQAIEQDSVSNINELDLIVDATDTDGDITSTSVLVSITDGDDPTTTATNAVLDENDIGTPDYQAIIGNITLVKGSDLVESVVIDSSILLNSDWLGLTSNGQAVELELDSTLQTGETDTLFVRRADDKSLVLEIVVKLDGSFEISQQAPLDQLSGNSLDLSLPVVANDSDGDNSHADVLITVNDGDDPIGVGDVVTIKEATEVVFGGGQVLFTPGSEDIADISFDPQVVNDASWLGLITNGEGVSVALSDSKTLIVTSDSGKEVLKVTIDNEGNYQLTQSLPIEQDLSDVTQLILPVIASDSEGDTGTVDIVINIQDNLAPVAQTSTLQYTETGQSGQTNSGAIVFVPGSDAVQSIILDSAVLDDPAWGALTSNGQATTLALDTAAKTLTLSVGADPVLVVNISDDGSYSVVQNAALDQRVAADLNDLIIPVIGTDFDGDQSSANINIQITDGDEARVTASSVAIDEDDVIDGTASNSGSINLILGSDTTASVSFTLSEVQKGGWESLTSNGQATQVVTTANSITVQLTDGTPVLTLAIDIAGNYTVTQLQALDQIDDITSLQLGVDVIDSDGDTVSTVIDITINDGDEFAIVAGDNSWNEDSIGDDTQPITGDLLYQGSDAIADASLNLSDSQRAIWETITSNGEATTLTVTDSSIVVKTLSGETVLQLQLNGDGSYSIEQLQAIDQDDDALINPNQLKLAIDAVITDTDGDQTSTNLSFTIQDGSDPVIVDDIADLFESDIGDLTTQPFTGDLTLTAGSDAVTSIEISDAVIDSQSPWQNLTSNGLSVTASLSSSLQTNINDTLSLRLDDGTLVMQVIVNIDGSYTVDLRQPLDQDVSNLTRLLIPVQVTDSDLDSALATITVQVTDGDDPSGIDSDVSWTETTTEQAMSGTIDFSAGSEDIQSIEFDPALLLAADWIGLLSEGESVSVALTNGNKTLTVTGADSDALILSVSIDNDGNYDITQHRPIEQNGATNSNNLVLPVLAKDSDGDSGSAAINITINDALAPSGEDANLNVQEQGLPTISSGEIVFSVNSDSIESYRFDEDIASDPIWTALTSNGQATTLNVTDALITLSLHSDSNVVVLELALDANGGFTLTQNLPLDQDVISNINQLVAGVIATDFDGDSASADIIINITDGADPKITDGTLSLIEGVDGTVTNGFLTITKGIDDIASVQFDEAVIDDPAWGNITSDGQATQVQLNGDKNQIIVFKGGDVSNEVLKITLNEDGSYTLVESDAIDQPNETDPVRLSVNVIVTDTDNDFDSGTINISIYDGDAPIVNDAVVDITEIEGQQSFSEKIEVIAGTDAITEFRIDSSITSDTNWINLVSNDQSTDVLLSADGRLLTVFITGDVNNKVLEVQLNDLLGNYTVTQFQAVDHTALEDLLLNIPVTATDSDGTQASGNIAVTISDGDAPTISDDSQSWSEDDIGDIFPIFTNVDLVTGSDDIALMRFVLSEQQTDDWSALTSNNQSIVLTVTDSEVRASLADGSVVLVVSLNLDGSYDIEQLQGLDQDASGITKLSLGVEVEDSDGDGDTATIDFTIADGQTITTDPAQVRWSEDQITDSGYSFSGDLNYQGSDGIESAVLDLTTVQTAAWNTITIDGEATTLEQNAQSLVVRSNGVIALQLSLNNDGSFELEQFLAIDQDNSTSDQTLLSAGVIFTDSDGDVTNSSISVTIDDGQNVSLSDKTEQWNEDDIGTTDQPIVGNIELSLGPDGLDQLSFELSADQRSAWNAITSNGQSTNLVEGERSLELQLADGTLILSISMDINGVYTIEQFDAIDQPSTDISALEVGILALDKDGDETRSSINLNIEDGTNIGLRNRRVTFSDDDIGSDSLPITGDLRLLEGSDDLASFGFNLTNGQTNTLNSITSNGEQTSFLVTEDNTLITVFLDSSPDSSVLSIRLNTDANGQFDGTFSVEQFEAIDQTNNRDRLDLALRVELQDTDGDITRANARVRINDGTDPTVIDDVIELVWNENNIVGGIDFPITGDIGLAAGVDAISSVGFALTSTQQTTWDALTSNGSDTQLIISSDGQTLTLVTGDTNQDVVLIGIIDINGNFSFEQRLPLDQFATDDTNRLDVTVEVTDSDSDVVTKDISLVIEDGEDPDSVDQTEAVNEDVTLDQDSEQIEGTIELSKGIDAIAQVRFDAGVLTDPAWTSLISNNQALELELNADGTILTLHVAGNSSDVVLIAGVDIDGRYNIELLQALEQDNNGSDSNILNLVVNAIDSDGDVSPSRITIEIADGTDPQVDLTPPLTVDESHIDQGDSSSTPIQGGSNPDGSLEVGSSVVTYIQGSDDVEAFYVDTDSISASYIDSNGQTQPLPLTYQGVAITFIAVAGGYMGIATVDGAPLDILSIQLNNTVGSSDFGRFDFEIIRAIDHPIADVADTVSIRLPVFVQDMDGDTSPSQDLIVNVTDDVPEVVSKSISVVEGDDRVSVNLLRQDGLDTDGADDGVLTAITIGDTTLSVDPTQGFQSFNLYSDGSSPLNPSDPLLLMGVLEVHPDGRVRFTAESDVLQSGDLVDISVAVTATDSDGDTDTTPITITVDDISSQITLSQASGSEDAGRSVTLGDTNPQDNILVADAPIKVNISVNTGDFDNSEQLGDITIKDVDPGEGAFYFYDGSNYVALAVVNGAVTLTQAQLQTSTLDNQNWSVENLYFVPARHQGSEGVDYRYSIEINVQRAGVDSETLSGELTVEVVAVADSATWDPLDNSYVVTVDEDDSDAQLSILAKTQDADGSESLSYEVSFVADYGQQLLVDGVAQTPDSNGLYIITADDIGKVSVNPADDWSGAIQLKVVAITSETDPNAALAEARSEVRYFTINVNPIADEGALTVTRIVIDEDTTTTLDQHIQMASPQDMDGSESLFVEISNLLDSNGNPATLNWLGDPADNPIVEVSSGVFEVAYSQLSQVEFVPFIHSNLDFEFTVTGIIRDQAHVLDPANELAGGGTAGVASDDRRLDARQIVVDLKGVADAPIVDIDGIGDIWEAITNDQGFTTGIQTTIDENQDLPLTFSIISGELIDSPMDNSESIAVLLSNIPEGVELIDEDNNSIDLVFVDYDDDGQPVYQANLTEAGVDSGIIVRPANSSTQNIELKVTIVVTENDGASEVFEGNVVIKVQPVIDAQVAYSARAVGDEDEFIVIDWLPTGSNFPDVDEKISFLRLEGIPEGSAIRIDGNEIEASELQIIDGEILIPFRDEEGGLVEGWLGLLDGSSRIEIRPPQDDSTDFELTAVLVVTESDYELQQGIDPNEGRAFKEITGTIDVVVKPVVEDGAMLSVFDQDDPDTALTAIEADAEGKVRFTINNNDNEAGRYSINIDDLDSSDNEGVANPPYELVDQLVVDFNTTDPTILDQLIVLGAVNNGDGTWVITDENSFEILAPNGLVIADDQDSSFSELNITFVALAYDRGDENEGGGERARKETDITLRFPEIISGNDSIAADIGVNTDADDIILGIEDGGAIDLGQQISDKNIFEVVNADNVSDQLSIVFKGQALPAGFSINGADYDYVNDEYIYLAQINPDGTISGTGGLTLSTPNDYAGDLILNFLAVTTDTLSGHEKSFSLSLPIAISPEVEADQSLSVEIVGTSGLNDELLPVNSSVTSDVEVFQPGIAYEDGLIHLNIDVSSTDLDVDLTRGVEEIQSITIAVSDPSEGWLVDTDGNLVESITLNYDPQNPNAVNDFLQNVRFKPAQHFPEGDSDNTVSLTISGSITDTTDFDETDGYTKGTDQDSVVGFSGEVSFEIVPVLDPIIVAGGDRSSKIVITGQEDTDITLDQVNGDPFVVSLTDTDGSEEFVSIRLTDVPDGFLVRSRNETGDDGFSVKNNGNGFWTIQLNDTEATSVSFDDIVITPAENFSGTVDIGILVFTQEQDLAVPTEHNAEFTLVVLPQGDTVDSDISTSVIGVENQDIEILLNAYIVDNDYALPGNGSGGNYLESAPETLRITVENVPQGGVIKLEDGTVFTDNGDGSWVLDVEAQQLDKIVFNSGDNNSSNWDPAQITVKVQSVDTGLNDFQSLGSATEQVVDISIEAVNDQPMFGGVADLTSVEDDEYNITNLSISDPDTADDPLAVYTFTISVDSGLLAFADDAEQQFGISITPDIATDSLQLTGTVAQINAALADGVRFNPDADFYGQVSVDISIDDGGNIGVVGEPNTNAGSFIIDVEPKNDQPIISSIADSTVLEDGSVTLTDIAISDVDALDNPDTQYTVTLSVPSGQGSFGFVGDPDDFSVIVSGLDSDNVAIDGTVLQINALLSMGVIFSPAADYNGTTTVTVEVDDNGNLGVVGEPNTNQVTFDIEVIAENDAPLNQLPTDIIVDEGSEIKVTGIQVSDVDYTGMFSSSAIEVILSVDIGLIDVVTSNSNVVITSNATSRVVLNGPIDDVNAVLAEVAASDGIFYRNQQGSDAAQLTVTTRDNGVFDDNGTVESDSDSVTITINPVANAPTLALDPSAKRSLNTLITESAIQSRGIPVIGLIAALTDIGEALSIEIRGLDANAIVEANSGSVVVDNGVWVLDETALSSAVVKYPNPITPLDLDFEVVAVSKEFDGVTELDSADSIAVPYTVTVVADDAQLDASAELDSTTVVSGDDASVIIGSSNDDELIGGEGDDILDGGLGADILTGGGGADSFIWQVIDDTVEDIITDFNVTDGDSIDLVSIFDELETNLDLDSLLDDFADSQQLVVSHIDNTDDIKVDITLDTQQQSIVVKGLYSQLDTASDPSKDLLTVMFENSVFKYDGS
ncbi:retention module-containing protein [Vibrio gallicus]|uniref:retention module-containing protein n=1 Tax=Vibrio gallicus TaxID=190897 RepID=UPI0021C3BF0A|nr:retention module-containing protein [Vibrio gallicus]